MARAILLGSLAATALASPDMALAQTPSPSDPQSTAAAPAGPPSRVTTYDAAYFTQYAPRTALDIARRVPGFQLDLGSTQTDLGQVDVRGFAGTAGNVVFNGARPSPRRNRSRSCSPVSLPSGSSASNSARAIFTAPTIPARARS